MRIAPLIAGMLVLVAVTVGAPTLAAAPAWDITGKWTSYVGDLNVKQTAGGALTGTFAMKVGCTDTYSVAGKVDGSKVAITLTRAGGGTDSGNCAGSQSLNGTINDSGTRMQLALANAYQTSPPTPFTGTAKKADANKSTSLEVGATKRFSVFVKCKAPRSQRCPTPYAVRAKTTTGHLRARFITSKSHCSDVRLRFSVDGGPPSTSAFIGRDVATLWYTFAVKAGTHLLAVEAEGRPGGCNTIGYLKDWGGTLELRLKR